MAILLGTLWAPAAYADSTADIPGVPLPGPVAAGRLGGTIYDVVYRFTVPAGHVIVASVTGTDGTDFDLYLFDSTATTVVTNNGLLTKSVGPTSTESISWPSRFGGTYYLDLNGATDVEGDYRLTVQTIPDPTAPTVSVTLAAGRASTNLIAVPVTTNALDDLSGVIEMALSDDGLVYTAWQPFAPTTTWTFTSGDGPRTLWVKVRNGVGLESIPASDTVVIDTGPPSVVALDPAPGSSVAGLRPRFTVTFDEAMDPTSWTELGLIVQSATGALVGGSYTYAVATKTGTFVPSSDLVAGATYVVTIAGVTDVAGNGLASLGSWSIVPLVATHLSAHAAPAVVLRGQSARIDMTLTGAPLPAMLDVLSTNGSGPFATVTSIPTDDGHNSLIVSPTSNTTYRIRYAGLAGVAPTQIDVPILVRRSAILFGRDPTITSRAKVGSALKLTAAISPAAPGASVSFRMYRFDTARRAWVYAGSHGRKTDGTGRASITWSPGITGSFYWRVTVASTADFANNISPVYRWSITR